MLKNNKIAVCVTLLALINLNCHAINTYLSTTVPTIMRQLQNNTDELIAQRRTIDVTKQALDKLTKENAISKAEADQAKNSLEAIFAKNIKQASSYQRAVYNMKRPFQFVYNKITDPNASYLERFAYTAAATVGVAITSYAVYQGGKYAYSALPNWQKKEGSEKTPQTSVSPNVQQAIAIEKKIKHIKEVAKTPQEEKDLLAIEGLIWDPIAGTITSTDDSFVQTADHTKIINGTPLSKEEKLQAYELAGEYVSKYIPEKVVHREISYNEADELKKNRPNTEWEEITQSFKKADNAFDRSKRFFYDKTAVSPEEETDYFKKFGLILNTKNNTLTDPKTGVAYNYLQKEVFDPKGNLVTNEEMQVIGRFYYHRAPGLHE